jgi:hypothetical protein
MGKGGREVNRKLRKDVRRPRRRASCQGRKKPPIKIGICIGRKVEPAMSSAWKAIGKRMPMARRTPPRTKSCKRREDLRLCSIIYSNFLCVMKNFKKILLKWYFT